MICAQESHGKRVTVHGDKQRHIVDSEERFAYKEDIPIWANYFFTLRWVNEYPHRYQSKSHKIQYKN